ncbi:glycosyltransferase family 4 protein [Winogradskyella alexanderae]|uniref:Glycosyltransferase family 4 protein n=1 Tax=Winogradskyella alexanderae TaxID=2877123 RepID=A0ABS7XRC0_9FLAO|nr:glycosyltransferase family 4 protein [Winogradskyella alexanderae]MCA0131964.1 glycosyltransferase family 4 protein [Winogradskyella alexanderae]
MTNVLYVGNALSKKGRTQTTIDTLGYNLKEFCNVRIVSKKRNKILRLIDMVWAVFRYRTKTDFVLIDTYSTMNFYYALVVSQCCRLLNKNYITILHGGNLENRLKNNPKICQLIFNNAFKLVTPSLFLKTIFENYNYTNLVYIPNSIEIENYTFQRHKIENINLLWVRSFSSIYNPKLAVDVLVDLKNKGHDATLTMIGPEVDGSLEKVKSYATHKKVDVEFTGKLEKSEWIKKSKNKNVFINTTNIDNTPISVIEAMALGLPVVSTNVGGLPFLVQDGKEGLLVEPNNSEAMSHAILKLFQNEEFVTLLTENARKKVEDFDWTLIKLKWQLLLQYNC